MTSPIISKEESFENETEKFVSDELIWKKKKTNNDKA